MPSKQSIRVRFSADATYFNQYMLLLLLLLLLFLFFFSGIVSTINEETTDLMVISFGDTLPVYNIRLNAYFVLEIILLCYSMPPQTVCVLCNKRLKLHQRRPVNKILKKYLRKNFMLECSDGDFVENVAVQLTHILKMAQ